MGGKEEKSSLEEAHDDEAIVLTVFMHCEGCARKVRRCLKGFQGVESVETDCSRHRVVVRGEKADPLKVLGRLQTKTHKRVELISPIPNPNQQEQQQQHPAHIITLLLKVHMHCHACAQHIKTTIHRIKGVESVEADLKTSQVRVKGAIHPAHLLQYLHRTTRKHAHILNQEPQQLIIKPPPPHHNNNSQILLLEPAKHDDHDHGKLILQDKKDLDAASQKKPVDIHDEQVTQVEQKIASASASPDVKVEEEVEEEEEEAVKVVEAVNNNEYNNNNNNNNVVCYPQRYIMAAEMYPYPPPLPPPVIGHAYPPQMFSDENPNACSLM